MKRWLAALIAIVVSVAPAGAQDGSPPPRVVIASDSTAAVYPPDQFPQMGWGMFLGCSLAPGVAVVNLARGGRSTKTFAEEGLWGRLLAQLRPGDTVLIQFGHNDEDTTKMFRHTEPAAFGANLTRFVSDVRARGGVPVLMTPVARHEFKHGRIEKTHGAYARMVVAVAQATHASLIDFDARSRRFFNGLGEEPSARYFLIYSPADRIARFPDGHHDTTHLNELGARATAAIVGQALAQLKLPIARGARPIAPAAVRASGDAACH